MSGVPRRPPPGPLDNPYVIWSHEHSAWWATPSGYTQSLKQARQWPREHALSVCYQAMPGTASRIGALPDLPVRLFDVLAVTSAHLAIYPNDTGAWE